MHGAKRCFQKSTGANLRPSLLIKPVLCYFIICALLGIDKLKTEAA